MSRVKNTLDTIIDKEKQMITVRDVKRDYDVYSVHYKTKQQKTINDEEGLCFDDAKVYCDYLLGALKNLLYME